MKYQQLENLEAGWRFNYLKKKHFEGEAITRHQEKSAALYAVELLFSYENLPKEIEKWIKEHLNPALDNRMKQTIRAKRKRHFNAEHQSTKKKSIDLEYFVWKRLADLAKKEKLTLSEVIIKLIDKVEQIDKNECK